MIACTKAETYYFVEKGPKNSAGVWNINYQLCQYSTLMRPASKNSLKVICFHSGVGGEKKTGEKDEFRKHAVIERNNI